MECIFCKKVLGTKYSLQHHQKTAKYCLSLQGKNNECYRCKYCDKVTTTNHNLKSHYSICIQKKIFDIDKINKDENIIFKNKLEEKEIEIKKYKKELSDQKKENEKLQNKLENVLIRAIDKPTTTNNTVNDNRMQQISNLIPLTEQHFLEQAENLTIDHIKDGGAGYARLAVDYTLKDRSICADFSRKKLVYKEEDGTITNDPGLNKIAPIFFKSILDKHADVVCQYRAEQYKKFGIDTECTDEEKKAYSDGEKLVVIGEVTDLVSQGKRINSIAKGKDLDDKIMEDFRRVLCALLSQ